MSTGRRAYHSPRREQDAAATRAQILASARALFTARGYGRVTVADIARGARVAVKTVYASAGGKAEILAELIGSAVETSGAHETLAEVRKTADLREAVAILARGTRTGNETYRESIDLMYAALGVHDDAEALWRQGTELYREVLRDVAAHLEQCGALRDGLDADRAADMLWFCFGTGSWRTLVKDCGWSWDEAQRWLAGQAVAMLGPEA